MLYWNLWGRFWVEPLEWDDIASDLVRWRRPSSEPAATAATGAILILPGLNGTHLAHYIEQFIHEVARKKKLDVYVVNAPENTIGVYSVFSHIEDAIDTIHNIGYNGKIGIAGFSAGGIPVVKYVTVSGKCRVDYAIIVASALNLVSMCKHISWIWAHILRWCVDGIWWRSIQAADRERALKHGYTRLEAFYEAHSCHMDITKTNIPLYVFCARNDPMLPDDHFRALYDAYATNPLVIPLISKYGGHLGWNCCKWFHNTILESVI